MSGAPGTLEVSVIAPVCNVAPSRPRTLGHLLARLRYHWRLWVWRSWPRLRRKNRKENSRSAKNCLNQLVRPRHKNPFHLDDFLREHPCPLVAATSLVDGLERFFPNGRLCLFEAGDQRSGRADLLICWLYRDLGRLAAWSRRTGQPILLAEDAFLKSILTVTRPGPRRYTSNTAVFFDDLGYHYAAARPSRLEVLLNSLDLSPEEVSRGAVIREKLVRSCLTKYNHQPMFDEESGRPGRKKVLVVDQSFSDASVAHSLASTRTFSLMLQAALKEHPEADIIVKKHPDAIARGNNGRRTSYFQGLKATGRIFPLVVEANPYSVIEQVEAVYTVSSQMGLEALMAGKPVRVFGLPCYAGWGLTQDHLKCPRRTRIRTIDELVFIIYGLYTRYAAEDGRPLTAEETIEHLIYLRDEYFAATKGHSQ